MGDIRRSPTTVDERGSYLVLYALLTTALFTMAALVIDMGSLRQDRRAAGLAADLAATSAAALVDSAVPTSAAAACQAAWEYFRANATDDIGAATAPACADLGATPCDPATARPPAVGTAGPYRVEITNPVLDGTALMKAEAGPGDTNQAANPALDGSPCDRLGVRILRTRQFALAPLVGITSAQADVHAVARPTNPAARLPGLVVLDPHGCRALDSSSGGTLSVAGPTGVPGIILVASDGRDCLGADYVINTVDFAGMGSIQALGPGVIRSAALTGPYSSTAYSNADVTAGRLSPRPTPATTTPSAAFIVDRFNCTAATCPPGTNPIGQLQAALGGTGVPTGYVEYTSPCSLGAGDPSPLFVGDVFVNCPAGFTVANKVTFPGNVVFAGGVDVSDGGCLAVGSTVCGGAAGAAGYRTVYLRAGNLVKSPAGRLALEGTFAYLTPGPGVIPTGRLVAAVGSGSPASTALTWTAPVTGPFEDLLLWAASSGPMQLGGRDNLTVEGTLFAPSTTRFELVADSPTVVATAQLVAGRVTMAGSREFRLQPAAGRAIEERVREIRLLR